MYKIPVSTTRFAWKAKCCRCVCNYIYARIHIRMFVCIYVPVQACLYVYMFVCVYDPDLHD